MAQSFSVEVHRKTDDGDHWETIHEWVHELKHAIDSAQEVASREKARTQVVRNNGTVVAKFDANGNRVKLAVREARRRRKYTR